MVVNRCSWVQADSVRQHRALLHPIKIADVSFHPNTPALGCFSAIYTQRSPPLARSATGYLLSLARSLVALPSPRSTHNRLLTSALSHATLHLFFCPVCSWFVQSNAGRSGRCSRSLSSRSRAYLSHALPESGSALRALRPYLSPQRCSIGACCSPVD